jgi:hypothetical protein
VKLAELASRSWYYFRIGYNTYLVFLIGYGSTLVTIYYLAIRSIPELQIVFQRFSLFVVLATLVGVPVSVLIGWIHTKRSSLWKAELDIGIEANPYYYRLPPGYYKEATFPVYWMILRLIRKLSEKEDLLSEEDKMELDELEKRIKILLEGGYVGVPKRRSDL